MPLCAPIFPWWLFCVWAFCAGAIVGASIVASVFYPSERRKE